MLKVTTHIGVGAHRRREDVSVFRVVGHCVDQGVVAGHGSVGERPAHLRNAQINSVSRGTSFDQVAVEFGEHVGGPQRAIRLRFGEPQQQVSMKRPTPVSVRSAWLVSWAVRRW
jgi:hypothetical protein